MTIYLVGGAPHDGLDDMWDAFVASAAKRGPKFAVALMSDGTNAADYLDDYFAPIVRRFPEADIEPIWLLKPPEEASELQPQARDHVRPSGIIIGDGSTVGACLDALETSRAHIASLVRGGTQFIGFGTGAAVVAKHAIAGGWRYQGNQVAPELASGGVEEVSLRDGLGLIGLAVEPRADTAFTTTRAMAALHTGDLASAMALDERVCLAIDAVSGQTKVLGGGRVCWLTRHAKQTIVRFEAAPAPRATPSVKLEATEPDVADN
ncbi:MAG: hypothetical protein LBM94_04050 [Propionibacteriaceae bacterium]|nr:hypothetical protein [Propionibacteriaceae bacterium]